MTNSVADDNTRTFVSYTHDSPAHKDRVLELADQLRSDGIDCHLDQYEDSPPEGWQRWMLNQIEESAFVLVICTEVYERRFRGKEEQGRGLGATWEGAVITQAIYDNASKNTKFIPVLFSADDAAHIPIILRSATHYRLNTEDGYEDLYRRLTDQRSVVKPPLGTRRSLPPRNRRSSAAAGAVTDGGATHSVQDTPSPLSAQHDARPLVLLFLLDGRFIFVPALKIESGEKLTLQLAPGDAKQVAYLADLRRQSRKDIAVAYGNTAQLATIESVSQVMEASGEVWLLSLQLPESSYRSFSIMESSINGITPDEIAQFRARRILLNEKQPPSAFGRNQLTGGLIESYVTRGNGPLSFGESPLPVMYQNMKDDLEHFLSCARLMLIIALKLTGTVEHVFNLDLRMRGEEVEINFQGQRAPQYQNAEPFTIEVKGTCKLQ